MCRGVVRYLVFFFFFKQKTAYEMRISDWSSDVCSSDLDTEIPMRRPACLALLLMLSGCVTAQGTSTGVDAEPRLRFLNFAGYDSPVLMVSVNAPFHLDRKSVV